MDVLFVIDATGSMSSALRAAHSHAGKMAEELKAAQPDTDFRFGSVCYRDPVDVASDEHEVCQFTSDINVLATFFGNVRAKGGGDGPEDWAGAFKLSMEMNWREAAMRVMIIMADAPAHGRLFCGYDNHEDQTEPLMLRIQEIAERDIVVQAFDIGSGAVTTFKQFEKIYTESHGASYEYQKFEHEPSRRLMDRYDMDDMDGFACGCTAERMYMREYDDEDDEDDAMGMEFIATTMGTVTRTRNIRTRGYY